MGRKCERLALSLALYQCTNICCELPPNQIAFASQPLAVAFIAL
jgi:hypothetical protein